MIEFILILLLLPMFFLLILILGGNSECYECGVRIKPKPLTRKNKCDDCT